MRESIFALLDEYLRCAEQLAKELRVRFATNDLLAAVNSGAIPRHGSCHCFGGGTYFFHGSGCRIQCAEIEIDFDFGPNGTLPGADPWKLYNFANAHAEAHRWLPSRPVFDQAVKQLVEDKSLCLLGLNPSPHLLRRR